LTDHKVDTKAGVVKCAAEEEKKKHRGKRKSSWPEHGLSPRGWGRGGLEVGETQLVLSERT